MNDHRHDGPHPDTILWIGLFVYLVIGWCLYARWATNGHDDCMRALTPECVDRVLGAK